MPLEEGIVVLLQLSMGASCDVRAKEGGFYLYYD